MKTSSSTSEIKATKAASQISLLSHRTFNFSVLIHKKMLQTKDFYDFAKRFFVVFEVKLFRLTRFYLFFHSSITFFHPIIYFVPIEVNSNIRRLIYSWNPLPPRATIRHCVSIGRERSRADVEVERLKLFYFNFLFISNRCCATL